MSVLAPRFLGWILLFASSEESGLSFSGAPRLGQELFEFGNTLTLLLVLDSLALVLNSLLLDLGPQPLDLSPQPLDLGLQGSIFSSWRGSRLRSATAQELLDYEIQVDENANERYGAFRVGTRDDQVTALGLAVHSEPRLPGVY